MTEASVPNEQVRIACAASPGFESWVAEAGGTIAITTYQAGKVAMIGWDGQRVTLLMREFDKPLGLAVQGGQLALATRHDVTLLANAPLLAPDYLEHAAGKYDALFLPRATYHTGELHTHDLAFQGDELLLVNTRFSCLARLSREYHFSPVWKPKFVGDLVPEDRCHLNGLAMREGRPKYVTALGVSDTAGGWREKKVSGGVVIDVDADEIIVEGLSMPHSPRWHDGRLWVLNSGAGELIEVVPETGQTTVQCSLPGYLRGLSFVGPYALIGLSQIREAHIFGGMPVQAAHESLRCGVVIFDLRSRSEVGTFEFSGGCEELYDVQFLPGIHRPMILNLAKDAVRETMTDPESSFWLRRSSEIEASAEREGDLQTDTNSDSSQSPIPGSEIRREAGALLRDSATQL